MVEDMFKNLTCPPEYPELIFATLKNMLKSKEEYEQQSLEAIQKKSAF